MAGMQAGTDLIGAAAKSEQAATGRLASLRRLYHHVAHGGTTTAADEARVGGPVTEDNLRRLIAELEGRTSHAGLDGAASAHD